MQSTFTGGISFIPQAAVSMKVVSNKYLLKNET